MIKVEAIGFRREKIKANGVSIFDRDIRDIRRDEFGPHCQDIAPCFDPGFGIVPVTLGGVRNFGERIRIFRRGTNDFHLARLPRERVEIRVAIVNVHAFGALQFVHHQIRQRSRRRFVKDLSDVTRDDQVEHR